MAPLGVQADTIQTLGKRAFRFYRETFRASCARNLSIPLPRQFASDAITTEQPPSLSLFFFVLATKVHARQIER